MFNFGRNKEMTPRPEKDQKFSMKNKTDRTIFLFVIISLLICCVKGKIKMELCIKCVLASTKTM